MLPRKKGILSPCLVTGGNHTVPPRFVRGGPTFWLVVVPCYEVKTDEIQPIPNAALRRPLGPPQTPKQN